MFSIRVVSLSWPVLILSVRISLFALAWLSRINVVQESWRGHACNRLGRNKWHYSSFVSIHLSARCIHSRPRTNPSTPNNAYIYIYSRLVSEVDKTYLCLIGCKRNLIHKYCDNYIRCTVFRLLLWILYMFICHPYWKSLRNIITIQHQPVKRIQILYTVHTFVLLPPKLLQTFLMCHYITLYSVACPVMPNSYQTEWLEQSQNEQLPHDYSDFSLKVKGQVIKI
jgi:hypothetical protein